MKPGRELDALVAEKVFGEQVTSDGYLLVADVPGAEPIHKCEPLEYSTDIAAAWEVVEKLNGPKSRFRLVMQDNGLWMAYWAGLLRMPAKSKSAPHAICLAALKAIGGIE